MAHEQLLQVYLVRIPAICALVAGIIAVLSSFSSTFEYMRYIADFFPLLILYALIGGIILIAFKDAKVGLYRALILVLPIVVTLIVISVSDVWVWMIEKVDAEASKALYNANGGEYQIYEAQPFTTIFWESLTDVLPVFALLLLYSLFVVHRLVRAGRSEFDERGSSA